ncbi:HAD family hydrolase [Patulibacter minatonensis]|uniref:HAD family hydrolase n=1 Tax=Patulibacter minatonensis TaxID=298163 RepID=UPI00047CA7AF|nr:HAD hydrolase family protein [Patulibacter minatonensis]
MSGSIYLDLDGTLLDPGGLLVQDSMSTLQVVRDSGFRPVILTGRSRWAAAAIARTLGVEDVVCELGAVVLLPGIVQLAAPEAVPFPREALLAALTALPLQEHEPGTPRTSGLVLRSAATAATVTEVLHDAGFGEWCAVDNGPSHLPTDDGTPSRVVHVLPSGTDKATGVRMHLQLRDLLPEACGVVGDSTADLTCASVVPRTFCVRSDDHEALRLAEHQGIPVTEARGAGGALEAVRALVAGLRHDAH